MVADFKELARTVCQLLKERQLKVVTAESCTGGWLAEVLTSIPGATAWFDRGFITYTALSKEEVLGVDHAMIAEHGVVSEMVAKHMAEGALKRSQANLSLTVTGIAGPTGGTKETPVGMVCFALASVSSETKTCCEKFLGDRQEVRSQAVAYILNLILNYLM